MPQNNEYIKVYIKEETVTLIANTTSNFRSPPPNIFAINNGIIKLKARTAASKPNFKEEKPSKNRK